MNKKNRIGYGVTADTIVAVLAFLVAVLSLWFAVQQNNASKLHDILSVQPHLVFTLSRDRSDLTYKIVLNNQGIGPAKIIGITLKNDGELVDSTEPSHWSSIVGEITDDIPVADRELSWLDLGDVVASGAGVVFVSVILDAGLVAGKLKELADTAGNELEIKELEKATIQYNQSLFDDLDERFSKLEIIVEYESFYGQKATPATFNRYK